MCIVVWFLLWCVGHGLRFVLVLKIGSLSKTMIDRERKSIFSSKYCSPVQDVADSCRTGAAMYGIAVAALGMLSTIATGLAIDAYGPISDNAGGIAGMAGMSHWIRERTDALDAAGNTTAAIGKVL
ncbi:hypothetical protein HYC85_024973 [Camellia sinensis]|uniref:H(+)-exporting diphosphatase n=1 Tax=Camellia sinensis TaxID=4442 RepID=A0A7J7GA59_CAMSI|nr:hypothetical protein HYC85_024973 [Camellia sinensis]